MGAVGGGTDSGVPERVPELLDSLPGKLPREWWGSGATGAAMGAGG